MLHANSVDNVVLQQVELNTISAAFPCLSTITSHLHKYDQAKHDNSSLINLFLHRFIVTRFNFTSSFPTYGLPQGNSQFIIPARITFAHVLYNNKEIANEYVLISCSSGTNRALDLNFCLLFNQERETFMIKDILSTFCGTSIIIYIRLFIEMKLF